MNKRWLFLCLLFSLISMNRAAGQSVDGVPIEAIVTVPENFTIEVYAQGHDTGTPTLLAFGPDERLYVLGQEGKLNAFEDHDGDGFAESQVTIYDNAAGLLNHAVGLVWHDGKMYISDSGRISILSDSNGDGLMDTITPIITGLISLQYWGHSNNGIAFGPDGKLYVGIGATTDHGPIRYQGKEALIMRMNPDGSEPEIFATGFRNPYDLTFSPAGDLFTADNNPDRFDKTLRYLPSEELDHVRQGQFYGFPEVFGEPYPGHDSTAPITNFFPSVASAGLVYYAADQFPRHYQNGVFVAQWGSIAHPVQARDIRNGYMVVYVTLQPTDDGTFTGDWEPFAMFEQTEGEYRPVDVTVGPDGSLYILEYAHAVVYRVRYTGAQAAEPQPTPTTTAETSLGEVLFRQGADGIPACITCHSLDEAAPGLGPSLFGLNEVAGSRVAGLDARAYIRESILDPDSYIVDGYPADLMYQEYATHLNDEQVEALVDYVLSLSATTQ